MPIGIAKPAKSFRPSSGIYTASPGLRQEHFPHRRQTVRNRPPARSSASRQATLTQIDFVTKLEPELLESDDENLLDQEEAMLEKNQEEIRRPSNGREGKMKREIAPLLLADNISENSRKRKRDAEAERNEDKRAQRLNRRDSAMLRVFTEDANEEDEWAAVEGKGKHQRHGALAALLSTPHTRPSKPRTSSPPRTAIKAPAVTPRTPQHQRSRMVPSSQSPEDSPVLTRTANRTVRFKEMGTTPMQSQARLRQPLAAVSPNIKVRSSPLIKADPYIKREPKSQVTNLTGLSHYAIPTQSKLDDDDLDAQPVLPSPSQGMQNRIASNIPWHVSSPPSLPVKQKEDREDFPQDDFQYTIADSQPEDEVGADDESETDEETESPSPHLPASPLRTSQKRIRTVHSSRPHSCLTETVSSNATTQPASSAPQPPPIDLSSSPTPHSIPLATAAGLKSFSQATTVDDPSSSHPPWPEPSDPSAPPGAISTEQAPTHSSPLRPKQNQQQYERKLLKSRAAAPHTPVIAISSSPRPEPPRVLRNVPGYGDVPILTDSQLLPASIMNFEISPVWTVEDVELAGETRSEEPHSN